MAPPTDGGVWKFRFENVSNMQTCLTEKMFLVSESSPMSAVFVPVTPLAPPAPPAPPAPSVCRRERQMDSEDIM